MLSTTPAVLVASPDFEGELFASIWEPNPPAFATLSSDFWIALPPSAPCGPAPSKLATGSASK